MNDLPESGRASNLGSPQHSRELFDKTTIGLHWATAVLVTIQFLIGGRPIFSPAVHSA